MEFEFSQREKYGRETVNKVSSIFKKHNIKHVICSEKSGWKVSDDLKYGDIDIIANDRIIKNDVKRNSISRKSIENFQGNNFIISDHWIDKFLVIPAEYIKELKIERWDNLSSGDQGLMFYKLEKLLVYNSGRFSLSDLIKTILTSNNIINKTYYGTKKL